MAKLLSELTLLDKRIDRLKKKIHEISLKHKGNEQKFPYHAGHTLGYWKGLLSGLEDFRDELENTQRKLS